MYFCQNVFLALTLRLELCGCCWWLGLELQTPSPSGCHPEWLAQSHRQNVISDVPRCHPLNNNSALPLSGSLLRFRSNSDIPKIWSTHWKWKEKHKGGVQNKNVVFLWPKCCWFYNFEALLELELIFKALIFLQHHFTEMVFLLLVASFLSMKWKLG